jgi:hypothetical protein
VCLGECVVVDRESVIQIRHCQHHAGRNEGVARHLRPYQRSPGKRAARKRDGDSGRRACPRIVIGEEREQDLLANGPVPGSPADTLKPPESGAVKLPHVHGVGDKPGLEETLELRVGAGEFIQRLGEDSVRLLAAEEEEEFAAEHEGGLGSADGVDGQRVRLPQVLDRSVAAHQCLGRAKFAQ